MARRKSLLAQMFESHQKAKLARERAEERARKEWLAEERRIAARLEKEAAQQRREEERAEQARLREEQQAERVRQQAAAKAERLAAQAERERQRQQAQAQREEQRRAAEERRAAVERRAAEAEFRTEAVRRRVAALEGLLHDRNRGLPERLSMQVHVAGLMSASPSDPLVRVGRVLPELPGGPHSDLFVTVPGDFTQAQPLVEGLGTPVDGEHVQSQFLAFVPGFVDERADEAGADAAALLAGVDLDACEVDLTGPVFDVEHADVCPAEGDDLPAAWAERAGVELALDLLIPPPGRGDVAAQGGLVQLEAELAIGRGGRPQCEESHAAACSGRITSAPSRTAAPPGASRTGSGHGGDDPSASSITVRLSSITVRLSRSVPC